MIKKFLKDITGITAREEAKVEKARLEAERKKQERAERKRQRQEKINTSLSEKEIADKKQEPWVDVIGFKVNKENIRNGFYELDWNDYFVQQLKQEGYGFDGDPDEEIVARWFREICINAAADVGVDMTDRATGYINVTKLADGKAEVK